MMVNLECYDLPNEIMENVNGKIKFYRVLKPRQHIIVEKMLHVVELENGLRFQIVQDIFCDMWAIYIGQEETKNED